MKVVIILIGALFLSGCMNLLGGLGTLVPNSTQLAQAKQMQEIGDVYLCFQIGGPPPIGGMTILVVPKGTKPALQWGANCQPMSAKVE